MFWDHVSQDIFEYFFFVFDWKFRRDLTKILLALKDSRIEGMMLIYKQSAVHLRGSLEAAETLINQLDLEKATILAPKEHEPPVLTRYKPLGIHEMILMTLQREGERLYIKHPVIRLTPTDAEEIADLLRLALPEWWGETTAEGVIASMKEMLWLGIRDGGNLVSVGNTCLTEFGSNIGRVATHEAHRGRGYATSIVSALVREILRSSERALIHVLSDNLPALRVYTKVGFKPYRTYLFIRGEKRANT